MSHGSRGWAGSLVGLLGGLLTALGACSDPARGGDARVDGGASGLADGGLADASHDLTTLRLVGRLTIDSNPAVGVKISARCGSKVATATSDDAGAYSVEADVAGCAPLVVEFEKEALVPNFRVIGLPPPASPLHLDIALSVAGKLQCNSEVCTIDGSSTLGRELDSCGGLIKQGYTHAQTGPAALPFVPGEYRRQDGALLRILGFAHYLFRDVNSSAIGAGPCPSAICYPVDSQVLDWFGDAEGRLSGADPTRLLSLTFDPSSGRWASHGPGSTVGFTCKTDAHGEPDIRSVPGNALDDVRADRFFVNGGENGDCRQVAGSSAEDTKVSEYWVCGPVDGSGWYGVGLPVPRKGCLNLKATDACGTPAATTAITVEGMDNGYRTEGWTDRSGQVCVEVPASEPIDPPEDLDFDGLGGEIVQLRISSVREGSSSTAVEYVETARAASATQAAVGCREPSRCQQLEIRDSTSSCAQ